MFISTILLLLLIPHYHSTPIRDYADVYYSCTNLGDVISVCCCFRGWRGYPVFPRLSGFDVAAQRLKRRPADRKIRGSNPTSASRPLFGQPGTRASFGCNTLLVPSCHATQRKHEGWDTAQGCPSLDRGSRQAEVGFESRTFRSVNSRSNHLSHLALINYGADVTSGYLSMVESKTLRCVPYGCIGDKHGRCALRAISDFEPLCEPDENVESTVPKSSTSSSAVRIS
ncbi:hypothetical protein T265_05885 [Opisthorchis viverrini]|uniref:Secreted protein n=1 Tax=Opisthorchis viverrini TaxID=6198 RepID=A0A074ZJ08_OPIVI|nr:hypothetical protein T265_05885 [Opisthorchis viverrini]KER26976.1 hypothetical protein T265_05885 [Opisthorchis viverrini]